MIKKIVSGGQTDADRAALDVALKFNIPHGGWIPKGRKTEDGTLPTWCPFRLQICFNGHNWLANELKKRKLNYRLMDNLFTWIDNFTKAQQIADRLKVDMIHKILDRFAHRYCPIVKKLNLSYHWSIMQAEYATDIVFNRQQDLQSLYAHLIRTAIHTVKPENIASFLGRKLHGN